MESSHDHSQLEPSAPLLDSLGLIRSRYGYYEAKQKPTLEELEAYYRDLYHQNRDGTGPVQYGAAELAYMRGQVEARHHLMLDRGWITAGALRLLDVGCGEGHSLKYFLDQGWNVRGLDFSVDGCSRMNPECLPFLTQGDVFENLEQLISIGHRFDVVILDNVLEHVLHPPDLLKRLHRVLSPEGVLIVEVPNDFSQIQMTALKEGWIDRAFWVSLPQHLTYFTAASLRAVCADTGWDCGAMLADFPVDWFLANFHSNYVAPKVPCVDQAGTKGKGAHLARVAIENMMRSANIGGLNRLYETMATLGVGRCVSGFFRHANDAQKEREP